MSAMRNLFSSVVRWAWFGFLLLLAFSYLVAGLSQRDKGGSGLASNTAPESLSSDPLDEGGLASTRLPNANDATTNPVSEAGLTATLSEINARRAEVLQSKGLQAAEKADWLTICRRMSLALIGNGLALEEIRKLEQLPETDRVTSHLTNLLTDPRFHGYWGERWTRYLVGTDGGEFIVYRRRRFRVWLTEVFAANRPYDQMVRDLITAEGLWTDQPEVNFLTATFDSNGGQADPVRLAARTSRAFLGLRIDCLQCHNDFLGNVNLGDPNDPREGMQTDFHQLAAFYTSAKTSGLQGVREGEVDYKYQYLDADEEIDVTPAVPFYPDLLPEDGTPRERLASWVTHPENHQASRAAVSHVWALMFGQPIGEAVDNLPLDESVNPMVDVLAEDFVANGFDLRRLIRLIALSDAFTVESRTEFEITPEHERHYAVFPLVRLRPEQVAGNVIQAARIKKTDRESSVFLQLMTLLGTNDFVTSYGDVGEDQFTSESVTITQRLLMMNGDMLREMINANPVLNATAHINMFCSDDNQAVETVFLCAFNRKPSQMERELFAARLGEADSREEAIEDMYWVLLNSSELAWNH